MAENSDTVEAPKDWDKAVASAYLRALGATQAEAARDAGVGERTLARWEGSGWWPKAMQEAVDRWMSDVVAASRQSVLENIRDGDAEMGLKILERTEPRLLPRSRSEVTGRAGAPIRFADMSDEEVLRRMQSGNRVAALAAKGSANGDEPE